MRHNEGAGSPHSSGAATAPTVPPHGPGEDTSMSSTQATRVRVRTGVYERTNLDGSTVYEIAYRDSDGRQRRETVGPKLKAAEARLSQVKADMSRGVRVARRADLTVKVAAEAWMASNGHLRPTTVAAYRSALDVHILPAFGHRRLESVTPDRLARWAQEATTLAYRQGYTPTAKVPLRAGTIGLCLRTLHRVYSHAVRRQGYAGTSPVAALERAERPSDEPKPMTILTPEQLASVVERTPARYRTLLATLAGTGCRTGEVLGLTWGDLDLAKRTARVTMQADRKGRRVPVKTGNGRRTLDLPGSLVTDLAARKLAAEDTAPRALVFPSRVGTVLEHHRPGTVLAAACEAAGVPVISPHGLRHAHASALLADGFDLAAVSRRLGHGSVSVTATTYAHLLEDDTRRLARRDRLDGLYGAATIASA